MKNTSSSLKFQHNKYLYFFISQFYRFVLRQKGSMDLKIDYSFKQLFGNEKNKKITVVFLNAILQRTGWNRIKDITFINTEFYHRRIVSQSINS